MNLWLNAESGLLGAYPFKVTEMVPRDDGTFELATSEGRFSLRVVERREERLWFAQSVAAHLLARGFERFSPAVPTTDGRYFVTQDGVALLVLRPVSGRAVRPSEPADLEAVARTLAEFQTAARGLEPLPGAAAKRSWGRWPDRYGARRNDLLRLRVEVAGRLDPSPIDRLFLEDADRLCLMADEAVALLSGQVYSQVAAASAAAGEVALHRLRCGNFVIDGGGEAHILELEHCRFDLAVSDLAELIAKAVRKDRAGKGTGHAVLSAYRSLRPLSTGELLVLLALLQFPARVFKVLDQHYNYRRAQSKEGVEHKLALELEAFKRQEHFVKEASHRLGVNERDAQRLDSIGPG